MEKLKDYLGKRVTGLIFPSNNDKNSPIHRHSVYYFYKKAWSHVAEDLRPTNLKSITHSMRAFRITQLFTKNIPAHQINKLSGHATIDSLSYYDLSKDEQNPSKKLKLTFPLL